MVFSSIFLFPVSSIECPVCTNVPGLGAGKCDTGKVPKVTCPDGWNQCMSLKGKMTVLGFTQGIELKNCSNNIWCDSASDYNGKNSKEIPPLPFPFCSSQGVYVKKGLNYSLKNSLQRNMPPSKQSRICRSYVKDVRLVQCQFSCEGNLNVLYCSTQALSISELNSCYS